MPTYKTNSHNGLFNIKTVFKNSINIENIGFVWYNYSVKKVANENEEHFSALFIQYIDDSVAPEFHRAMMSFLNDDALKRQLLEGKTPRITYKKTNGDTVVLSVYKLCNEDSAVNNTLWFFAKDSFIKA